MLSEWEGSGENRKGYFAKYYLHAIRKESGTQWQQLFGRLTIYIGHKLNWIRFDRRAKELK